MRTLDEIITTEEINEYMRPITSSNSGGDIMEVELKCGGVCYAEMPCNKHDFPDWLVKNDYQWLT